MNRVNIEEKSRLLNELRMKEGKKTFTRKELFEMLRNLGFNSQVVGAMIPKLFTYEELGNARLYMFPNLPIHKSQIRSCYDKCNKYKDKYKSQNSPKTNTVSEEEAISVLLKHGFKIQRCVGFDLEKLKAENPALYQKYLKYETI